MRTNWLSASVLGNDRGWWGLRQMARYPGLLKWQQKWAQAHYCNTSTHIHRCWDLGLLINPDGWVLLTFKKRHYLFESKSSHKGGGGRADSLLSPEPQAGLNPRTDGCLRSKLRFTDNGVCVLLSDPGQLESPYFHWLLLPSFTLSNLLLLLSNKLTIHKSSCQAPLSQENKLRQLKNQCSSRLLSALLFLYSCLSLPRI